MNKHVHRMLCRKYEQSAKTMLEELRKISFRHDLSVIKNDAVKEYMENLNTLRLFLDSAGITMPNPKWRYDDKDETTWLFTYRQDVNKNFLMLQARRR